MVWHMASKTVFTSEFGNQVVEHLEWDGRILRCGKSSTLKVEEPN